MSSTVATTTYPFTFTTYSNPTPVPFTKPTIVPSVFSWGSAVSCASNSVNPIASALPSSYPIDRPSGLKASCVISNAAEVNNHAFWDLYECCKSGDFTASGHPYLCTGQCSVGAGQTWQELGECLSKRVQIVVCKPDFSEIERNNTQASSIGSSTSAAQSTTRLASGSGSAHATVSGSGVAVASTGAAGSVDVVHATVSKAGLVMFAILAVGSVAGMFL